MRRAAGVVLAISVVAVVVIRDPKVAAAVTLAAVLVVHGRHGAAVARSG